ncbi:siderophore-interacting protein [Streptomyces sp. NPDC050636]|uniref:siderophore-interacting protein n=1 Tax=Streptomyces sp. NPDC050636 TaxID=3154510 RepID=UPI0034290FEC
MARVDGSARRRREVPEIRTYLATVLRVAALTPRMLRLTVGGPGLRGFEAGRRAEERIKLFFPPEGHTAPALPEIGPEGVRFPPGAPLPHARNYTVRRFDPAGPELDIDFVVHGDGRASNWARQATPGALLGIAGPTGGSLPSEAADLHLIAGDETALPAIASLLERLPSGARAQVIAEVGDAADRQQLEWAPGAMVSVQWVYRAPGAWVTPTPLERAVRAFSWPAGVVHAWVAGEAAAVRDIRRYLRDERKLGREELHASGYWRYGKTVEEWVQGEGEPAAEY